MSFFQHTPSPSEMQKDAWRLLGMQELAKKFTRFDSEFAKKSDTYSQSIARNCLNPMKFTNQSAATLCHLDEFARMMVLKDCLHLSYNPTGNLTYQRLDYRNFRWTKSRYRHGAYHYKIRYYVDSTCRIIVDDIVIDKSIVGTNPDSVMERPAIHLVKRLNKGKKIHARIAFEDLKKLRDGWELDKPISHVNTRYVAVNGMLNDLDKARWLMGVHLDWAYRNDPEFDRFTLIHNPTEGLLVDLWESGWDLGAKSLNADHLSGILVNVQSRGLRVNWLGHSQGGIIMQRALRKINQTTKVKLHGQQLALHATGGNISRTKKHADNLGMKIHSVNNNPFDAVPNIAGRNSILSLPRSFAFAPSLASEPGISPHTLPYMGMQSYYHHLVESGANIRAAMAKAYILRKGISEKALASAKNLFRRVK